MKARCTGRSSSSVKALKWHHLSQKEGPCSFVHLWGKEIGPGCRGSRSWMDAKRNQQRKGVYCAFGARDYMRRCRRRILSAGRAPRRIQFHHVCPPPHSPAPFRSREWANPRVKTQPSASASVPRHQDSSIPASRIWKKTRAAAYERTRASCGATMMKSPV